MGIIYITVSQRKRRLVKKKQSFTLNGLQNISNIIWFSWNQPFATFI